jgi:hypothetical protein
MHSTLSRNDAGKVMCEFMEFNTHLSSITSDIEVSDALRNFFSVAGEINHVGRFYLDSQFWKSEECVFRRFIVQFKRSEDAIKVINQYNLRSFGFDSVVVEIKKQLPISSN